MHKDFKNGYGKKVLIMIILFFMSLLISLITIRIIYFRNEQFMPFIDSLSATSFYFIIRLGVAIAKNRYGENMKDVEKNESTRLN